MRSTKRRALLAAVLGLAAVTAAIPMVVLRHGQRADKLASMWPVLGVKADR